MKTRNLLLALGCAAAFTACTVNDEPSVAPAPAKHVVTLSVDVAEPADTRVAYSETETAYQFNWSGDETLRVFYKDGSHEVYANFEIDPKSIEGKKASFTSEDFPTDFTGDVTIVYKGEQFTFIDIDEDGQNNDLRLSGYVGQTKDVKTDLADRTLLYAQTEVTEAGKLPNVKLNHMFSYLLLKAGLQVTQEDLSVGEGDTELLFNFCLPSKVSFSSTEFKSVIDQGPMFGDIYVTGGRLVNDCLIPVLIVPESETISLLMVGFFSGFSGTPNITEQPSFTYEPGVVYEVKAGNTKWLPVTVEIPEVIVDLSTLTADYVAQDGDILTGKATDKYKISVAAGATVTLRDVDISSFDSEGPKYAGINCLGDATLVIEGINYVKGAYHDCSGIHVPVDYTLTIEGTGKLTAESNGYGAGIGAGYYWGSAGNIIINSGEIIANGGKDCAGIGGSCERSCGNITINGGTVTATGGVEGAGIGSGGYHTSCGNITINGGTIIANGGSTAAGIGAGYESGSCGIIEITGGEVTATGGKQGAGIGSGHYSSSCGNIIISDGIVKAIGGIDGAGIGTGSTWYHNYQSRCGDITISGGTIEATKGGGRYL